MADLASLPDRKARQRDEVVDARYATAIDTTRRCTMISLVARPCEQHVERKQPPLRCARHMLSVDFL
jgi:hypothetical protein